MPSIQTKVNIPISKEQETKLKTKFGKAIELLPGKSERWLMLTFEDNCRMWFQGNDEPATALVDVKLFGKASAEDYEKLTSALTQSLEEVLGISPARTYVRYEEVQYWGWNGSNF
ncbi:MAG: Macrophage migration inhibitory factor (MIF) [Thermocaproicibacter melissae]|jgi:phenylpyruvate tautomerase PptA (4-oxalocrotonate tautomerase family)|uniref:phenylpyruvate tautomerase MIF-related protein n=1 Tax=Thermocaproicibacter melissae TaxID=2966552 RepID=UPI003A1017D9